MGRGIKIFLTGLVICLGIFPFFVLPVSAKTSFPQAFSDYQYMYTSYRKAHREYSLERDRYLKEKTLEHKQAALEATRKMLDLRAKTLDTYFITLAIFFLDTNPDQETQDKILGTTDNERVFLKGHQEKLEKTATLEDILVVSEELENRLPDSKEAAYRVLATTLLKKQFALYGKTEGALSQAEETISKMESEGEDTGLLRVWGKQIREKLSEAGKRQEKAATKITEFSQKKQATEGEFDIFKETVKKSNEDTKQAILFLFELLSRMKNTGGGT